MSRFQVIEHTVRCQHTRESPAGTEPGHQNDLRMHVKQYVPKSNPKPQPGDVTIIGAHATAFPKEAYEPLWDDLYEQMQAGKHKIRAIWIADVASQGQSGIKNEKILGPEASWWDHGRDLLFLINQMQDQMPSPIIGIGHSVGASHLTHLSLMHPRLLHSLVLIDPIIQLNLRPHSNLAKASTIRRDVWPSRQVAIEKFASNKFYQLWDKRVLTKWNEYGLRDLPTEKYPDASMFSQGPEVPVALSTTVAQEVYLYKRANYREARLFQPEGDMEFDLHPGDRDGSLFIRPESQTLWRRLPELRPSVLYVFGGQSPASSPELRREKMQVTGAGVGGSGGAANGKVEEATLDCGHLVVMEKPRECAEAVSSFVCKELDSWNREEQRKREAVKDLTRSQRVDISDMWRKNLDLSLNGKKKEASRNGSKI